MDGFLFSNFLFFLLLKTALCCDSSDGKDDLTRWIFLKVSNSEFSIFAPIVLEIFGLVFGIHNKTLLKK